MTTNGFGTMGFFNEPVVESNTAATAEVGIIIGYEPATPSNKRVYFPATKTFATRKTFEPHLCASTIKLLNTQAEEEKQKGKDSWKSLPDIVDVNSIAYTRAEDDEADGTEQSEEDLTSVQESEGEQSLEEMEVEPKTMVDII